MFCPPLENKHKTKHEKTLTYWKKIGKLLVSVLWQLVDWNARNFLIFNIFLGNCLEVPALPPHLAPLPTTLFYIALSSSSCYGNHPGWTGVWFALLRGVSVPSVSPPRLAFQTHLCPAPRPAVCLLREGEGGWGGRPAEMWAVATAFGACGRAEAPAAEENPDH